MKFLLRWLTIFLAVAFAVWVVPGIGVRDGNSMWWTLVMVALILGVVNVTVGNVLKFLSFPLMILSLGLFGIIINAAMLKFAAWLSNGMLGTGFYIDGWWPAIFASIIISIVSALLWAVFGSND